MAQAHASEHPNPDAYYVPVQSRWPIWASRLNVPALVSSGMLALAGVMWWHAAGAPTSRLRIPARGVALFFGFMAVDETVMVHERLAELVDPGLPARAQDQADVQSVDAETVADRGGGGLRVGVRVGDVVRHADRPFREVSSRGGGVRARGRR